MQTSSPHRSRCPRRPPRRPIRPLPHPPLPKTCRSGAAIRYLPL
jgi:hypothetical protein